MADQPARQRIVVPFDNHVIGEGFNSDTLERVGTALTVPSMGLDPIAPGQSAKFSFEMVSSQASLERSLRIGVEADVRYGLLSAGGKFEFAEESAVNTKSTYIAASCVVQNALRFGRSFQVMPHAEAIIESGDVEAWKRSFGDRFTQGLYTGGEFHTVVRVTSNSKRHQQRISASLHAELNGLVAGGGFKAAIAEAKNDSSAEYEVSVRVQQNGGRGLQIAIPGTEADSIRSHMNQFARAADENPIAYAAELVTYDTLALDWPSPVELEDRRRVLEDCVKIRQRYWSAISDLQFARESNAELLFEDLPAPETLIALEAEFRGLLNELMNHARAVSSGHTEPTFFVPSHEPAMPRFKRRQANRFAQWWVKRNDFSSTSPDERFLIARIGDEAQRDLDQLVEDLDAEAVEQAADNIRRLSLGYTWDGSHRLESMKSLPEMIDAPLEMIGARNANLRDLAGIEDFPRLGTLIVTNNNLRDVTALEAAGGLRHLELSQNEVADLGPLQGLKSLEYLTLGGNSVRSLAPLASLPNLSALSIAGRQTNWSGHDSDGPFILVENPVTNARALDDLPRLASPFTHLDGLALTSSTPDGSLIERGHATRLGDSNRFRYTPEGAIAGGEPVQLIAVFEWEDLNTFAEPMVFAVLHFSERNLRALAASLSAHKDSTLSTSDLSPALRNGGIGTPEGGNLSALLTLLIGGTSPDDALRIIEANPL